ncbi:hypothetical protein RN001_000528 [Aquatica leii]|uniref:RRM domain-containing protein n=1 Tax=Aquatica leii TaxID=1421715 RepID=A0AAN7Q764_9COLE|nr:hypothetical protein RN001_000528 [Aquatica leii]
MKSNKRLFINNLNENITEENIREKFTNYGSVTSVEIKERKNPVGDQTQHFAYITINVDDHVLHNCIDEFTRKKWKGQFLNLQVAKESFIERLKREREESDVKDTSTEVNGCSEIKPININVNTYKNRHFQDTTTTPKELSTKIEEGEISNHNQDNEKRLKSLMHMKEGYRQQKLQIKNALSNIDKKSSTNKIRFDNYREKPKNNDHAKEKIQLFDEEDEDNTDFNFKEQHQFDGIKGQKLIQLQSKFQNDNRFKMDSRFLEDDEEEQEEIIGNTVLADNEKEKQLEILESVLGQKLKRPLSTKDIIEKKKSKMMLRFDPSQPQHSKFEVQQEIIQVAKPKKKEKRLPAKQIEEQRLPEVSKDTFYKVMADLKNTFNEKEEFSLSKLFSNRIEQDSEKVEAEETITKAKILNNKKQQGSYDRKVFKYDSSDSEEDNDKVALKETPSEVEQTKNPGLQIKPRMWTETFFFKDDDYRLQEGFDFIKRLQVGEQDNFKVVRRNLKEIVRAKVKNNLRKNRPFKKKLGGNKKRIKVKRALKR